MFDRPCAHALQLFFVNTMYNIQKWVLGPKPLFSYKKSLIVIIFRLACHAYIIINCSAVIICLFDLKLKSSIFFLILNVQKNIVPVSETKAIKVGLGILSALT